jgi:mono/diheme cytochrome c family protein
MSPFGDSNGGPLTDEQIDAVVAFVRSWETNPPPEIPPEVGVIPGPTWTSAQIFTLVCASCHGTNGEGGIGPALNTGEFQERYDIQALTDTITGGHEATSMIAWGEILSEAQISQLAAYVLTLQPAAADAGSSFSGVVYPILVAKCQACHNDTTTLGGWDASGHDSVMTSGDHGPTVVPGDISNSLLAQRILGTSGGIMPPSGSLPQGEIQAILDWVAAGANND